MTPHANIFGSRNYFNFIMVNYAIISIFYINVLLAVNINYEISDYLKRLCKSKILASIVCLKCALYDVIGVLINIYI